MKPTVTLPGADLYLGDCLAVLPTLADGSADAIITDPPYHLSTGRGAKGGFMGQTWDGGDVAFRPEVWAECLLVAKPGAFLLAFGGTRTWHRLACAVEDAGWELRDTLCYMFGTGFPKAKSCLKPAWEPVILAMKPATRVPPLNIDECRVGLDSTLRHTNGRRDGHSLNCSADGSLSKPYVTGHPGGRWPANVLLQHHSECECRGTKRVRASHDAGKPIVTTTPGWHGGLKPGVTAGYAEPDGMETVEDWACHPECPVRLLDEQAGRLHAPGTNRDGKGSLFGSGTGEAAQRPGYTDHGGASRFFWCAKASKGERGGGNNHPTVKPIALCQWLCRLVSSPGETILDPFQGSGTTGLAALSTGRRYIGIEREPDYHAIAVRRLTEAAGPLFANHAGTVEIDSPHLTAGRDRA